MTPPLIDPDGVPRCSECLERDVDMMADPEANGVCLGCRSGAKGEEETIQ